MLSSSSENHFVFFILDFGSDGQDCQYLNMCIEWAGLSLKLIKKMLECMQDVCILVAHFIKLLVMQWQQEQLGKDLDYLFHAILPASCSSVMPTAMFYRKNKAVCRRNKTRAKVFSVDLRGQRAKCKTCFLSLLLHHYVLKEYSEELIFNLFRRCSNENILRLLGCTLSFMLRSDQAAGLEAFTLNFCYQISRFDYCRF